MVHYWSFPSEGIRLLPAKAEQTDLNIRQYLNESVAFPPTHGFGLVAPYAGDILHLAWPSDDYLSLQRTWHCMPCQQQETTLHNESHSHFDWSSCSYDESAPKLYSTTLAIDPRVRSRPSLHTTPIQLTWPYPIEDAALLCTLAIPGAFPEGLSAAFPFLNAAPPSGRDPHAFSLDAPAGIPARVLREQSAGEHGGLGQLGRLAGVLLLAVLAAWMLVARRYVLGKVAGVLKAGWAGSSGSGFGFGFGERGLLARMAAQEEGLGPGGLGREDNVEEELGGENYVDDV